MIVNILAFCKEILQTILMNRVQVNINNVSSQTISDDRYFSRIHNSTIPSVVKVTVYHGTNQTISKTVSSSFVTAMEHQQQKQQ